MRSRLQNVWPFASDDHLALRLVPIRVLNGTRDSASGQKLVQAMEIVGMGRARAVTREPSRVERNVKRNEPIFWNVDWKGLVQGRTRKSS